MNGTPFPGAVARGQAAVGWTALCLTLASAVPLGANRPVSWLALSAAAFLLALWQLGIDLREKWPQQQVIWLLPAAIAWVAVIVWALMQVAPDAGSWRHPAWDLLEGSAGRGALNSISADPAAGVLLVPRLAAYGCLFWIAVRAARDRDRAAAMIRLIAAWSALLALYGVAAAAFGIAAIRGGGTGGVSATFVGRNSYATYAIFGALANLASVLSIGGMEAPEDRRRAVRDLLEGFSSGGWIFVLGLAVCSVALAATQSRAGVVAGLFGLGLMLSAHSRGSRAGGRIAVAASGAVVVFVAVIAGSDVAARLLSTSGEEGRFAVYGLVTEGIAARPLLGHGLGAFQDVFRAYVPVELAFAEWDLAHDSYLENAFELGLPAAALLYFAIGLVVWRVWRGTVERQRDRIFPCLALGCAGAAALHAVFDFSLQIPAVAALFAFLLGLGWTQSFRRPRNSRWPAPRFFA